jgi:predicted RNA-binding Zn ribbon-like protein
MKSRKRLSGYRFVAKNLALDFVNTVGNRLARRKHKEHLRTKSDLSEWIRRDGLDDGGRACTRLSDALALREALYQIFIARLRGRAPRKGDIDLLNTFIRSSRAGWGLQCEGREWRWKWASTAKVSYPLARVIESAVDLLTSKNLRLLRQCSDEQCGWLFLDRSQGHRRKWCSMQDCGNRAKARRFFAKKGS